MSVECCFLTVGQANSAPRTLGSRKVRILTTAKGTQTDALQGDLADDICMFIKNSHTNTVISFNLLISVARLCPIIL